MKTHMHTQQNNKQKQSLCIGRAFVAILLMMAGILLGAFHVHADHVSREERYPNIATYIPFYVTAGSATLRGHLTETPYASTEVGFLFGEMRGATCKESDLDDRLYVDTLSTHMSFRYAVSGLDPETDYCYQAYGENTYGTSVGALAPFTTDEAPRRNNTDVDDHDDHDDDSHDEHLDDIRITDVDTTDERLIVEGELEGDGNDEYTVSVWYGERRGGSCSSADLDDRERDSGVEVGDDFRIIVRDLEPDTVYCYRVVAGSERTSVRSIRTDDTRRSSSNNSDDVRVDTSSVERIGATEATLSGRIHRQSDEPVVAWFLVDTQENDVRTGRADMTRFAGRLLDAGDTFSVRVTGLTPATSYYFRACAERDGEQDCGASMRFTTRSTSTQTTHTISQPVGVTREPVYTHNSNFVTVTPAKASVTPVANPLGALWGNGDTSTENKDADAKTDGETSEIHSDGYFFAGMNAFQKDAIPGKKATYGGVVENLHTESIGPVGVEIKLDPALENVRNVSGGTYQPSEHRIVSVFDSLEPGEQKEITFEGDITSDASRDLINEMLVSYTNPKTLARENTVVFSAHELAEEGSGCNCKNNRQGLGFFGWIGVLSLGVFAGLLTKTFITRRKEIFGGEKDLVQSTYTEKASRAKTSFAPMQYYGIKETPDTKEYNHVPRKEPAPENIPGAWNASVNTENNTDESDSPLDPPVYTPRPMG